MKQLLTILFCLWGSVIYAQEQQGITLSGSIQSDMLVPENDKETGAAKTEDFLTNTYAELQLQSKYIDAGARLEYMEHPLPGFENDFKGWGVPNFWPSTSSSVRASSSAPMRSVRWASTTRC